MPHHSARVRRRSTEKRFEELTPLERAEIAAAWERGAKWSAIAAEFDVSRWTVDLVREWAHLPLRSRSRSDNTRARRYFERTEAQLDSDKAN
jgi:FixJ family two-component response regulator